MPNQITTTTSKYLLPNGKEWNGAIHQMSDGSWMTGDIHTVYSVPLVHVPQVLDFPADGFVGKQDIFSKIFSNAAFTSGRLEEEYSKLDQSLLTLEKTIQESGEKINASLGRLESHIASSTAQAENRGTGTLVDSDLQLSLPLNKNTLHSPSIDNVSFTPKNSKPTFIYFGNAETGLKSTDEWLKAKTSKTFIEMVSRISPDGYVPEIDGYPELDLSTVLKIAPSSQVGFDGNITISFSSRVLITAIHIPLNPTATVSNIKVGEDYLYNEGTSSDGSIHINIEPTRTNFVSFDVQYTEPIPINSQIYIPLTENEEGNPEPDISAAEDFIGDPQAPDDEFIELTGDTRVYQRTKLELGKILISSRTYEETATFTNGPYYCKDGTLKTIFMEAGETLPVDDSFDSFFTYNLIINGEEFPINPSNRDGQAPRFYYINSKLSQETQTELEQSTGSKFITTDNDVIEWQIKTILNKSGLEANITPEVKGFKFIYTTSLDGGINA